MRAKSILFNLLNRNHAWLRSTRSRPSNRMSEWSGCPICRCTCCVDPFVERVDGFGDRVLRRHRRHRPGRERGRGAGKRVPLLYLRGGCQSAEVTPRFSDPDVATSTRVDPASDIETIDTELILLDLQTLDRAPAAGEGGPPVERQVLPRSTPTRRPGALDQGTTLFAGGLDRGRCGARPAHRKPSSTCSPLTRTASPTPTPRADARRGGARGGYLPRCQGRIETDPARAPRSRRVLADVGPKASPGWRRWPGSASTHSGSRPT